VLGPDDVSVCIRVDTVPELPENIPAEGIVVDIYVESINAVEYTLHADNTARVFPAVSPIPGERISPNVRYWVTVGENDLGCELGRRPTSISPEPQPGGPGELFLPLVGG
jgi:hypothetical protein